MKAGLTILSLFITAIVFCQIKDADARFISSRVNEQKQKKFASLELEDTSGAVINTSSLAGKTIYIDFWFTACAPCVAEIPYSKALQEYFARDTDIVFLSICIENIERKQHWKQMVHDKAIPGLSLFYALNRPQKINLKREYDVTFPTYIIVNKDMKVIGFDAPRPSEVGLVHWVIAEAAKGVPMSTSLQQAQRRSKDYLDFIEKCQEDISKKVN